MEKAKSKKECGERDSNPRTRKRQDDSNGSSLQITLLITQILESCTFDQTLLSPQIDKFLSL